MLIKNLFERNIARPINGVVKADQLDDASVWQELDEFVVTRETDRHLRDFFAAYLAALDGPNDPEVAGRIGVWISGFFGSGKSHFLKVLSYLLANRPLRNGRETKHAVEFFAGKVHDAMLAGDIQRAVAPGCDVVLFNIDSKADNRAGRDALLLVFLKVLNELQGYSGDHPHIAHMERHLAARGKLEAFKETFRELTGSDWADERDAYEFHRDEVVQAWSRALGQSVEAAGRWIDNAESNFSLTVENFCKWVKEYLDGRGPGHRLVFLVDEVGQFIGGDTHLMLNLQTIAENLGTACGGRAWVVVTSQEDIDAVLGEVKAAKAHDFSKIQGRFKTRLSLSSANVDEVIQKRLLTKRGGEGGEVDRRLREEYAEKGDILKHQLTFSNVGMTLRPYKDADDFARNYPFAPYQFQLLQKVFEAIRKAGATGLHLSRGERSILDAFQSAAKQVMEQPVGILVPLYRFYPSIESFLDTAVKRTIDQAGDNPSLEPFDVLLLQVLFLIRYIDEVKGNVDNLVTLCTDLIDADRLALRQKIEGGLQRLEKETLISRNGDVYFFLTNEERDISREIKAVPVNSGEEARLLGEIVFDDVLKGVRKHRYAANGQDFTFVRLCDFHPVGNRVENALVVSVVSPLADEYERFDHGKCILHSMNENGHVLVKLDDQESLVRELRTYLKTDKYITRKNDGTLPPTTRRILADLAEENRQRRDRLMPLAADLLLDGQYYVAGQALGLQKGTATAAAALEQALDYLVENTFSKMKYLKTLSPDPKKEIQAVLRANDVAQQTLDAQQEEHNSLALGEVRGYVSLKAAANQPVVLHEMISDRFAVRPYGWPDLEVVLLVARLAVLGEISVVSGGAALPADRLYDELTTPSKWRKITLLPRRVTDAKVLQAARSLGKEVFGDVGPDGEEPLVTFLRGKLKAWEASLLGYKPLAETGDYPGRQEIADGVRVIGQLLKDQDAGKFVERFNSLKNELKDLCDDYHDLSNFYEHQKPTWDRLRKACERFRPNHRELERDSTAAAALKRMREILASPSPYGLVQEADGLIQKVSSHNAGLVDERRRQALAKIDAAIQEVTREITAAAGDPGLRATCFQPLQNLRGQVEREESLAHISQAAGDVEQLADAALGCIEQSRKPAAGKGAAGGAAAAVAAVKTRRVIKPAEFVKKSYLETAEDIEEFLAELRRQLEAALSADERVQIR
jgi:hypothetical protein